MKAVSLFLRPNLPKILLLAILLAVTCFVSTGYKATSKVSWQENRGIPLAIVTLAGYEGPGSNSNLCREVRIQNIWPIAFILDIFVWYMVSCLVFLIYIGVKIKHQKVANSEHS
jgi:hypothetical protein